MSGSKTGASISSSERRNADGVLGVLGRKDVDDVAAYPEATPVKIHVVALIPYLGKPLDDRSLVESIAPSAW